MSIAWTSYYGLLRVNNSGPEVKNWAATDGNPQSISQLIKALEGHHHNAATPMSYPGYNTVAPSTPIYPALSYQPTGGSISAGTSVGVRLSFVDQVGLETDGSPEISITMPAIPARADMPVPGSPITTPVPGALQGGTRVYALTKQKKGGEGELSDVSIVQVPFNASGTSSYVVPLTFTYSAADYSAVDQTDTINLYCSTGMDASFSLLHSFTSTPDVFSHSYTDDGTVVSNQQPPQSSQFGQQNLVNINWASLSIPSNAYRFRIYVTQQPGVYSNTSLLYDYDLKNPATPVPNNVNFYGTETLIPGYPNTFSQLLGGQSKINLTSEAIGAPIYTQIADAQGYQTYNFVFPDQNHATPLFGSGYVDRSTGQLKVALATPSGANNPAVFTTLAGVGTGYAHPLTEAGGHTASHIYAAPTGLGGPTQDQLNAIFSTPVAGGSVRYRIQATNTYVVTATPAMLQNSTAGAWVAMPDMDTNIAWPSGIQPDFAGQWFEVNFSTNAWVTWGSGQSNQWGHFMLYINGQPIFPTDLAFGQSYASAASAPLQMNAPVSIKFATPLTRSNNRFQMFWQVVMPGAIFSNGSNVANGATYRTFMVNERF